MKRHDHATWQQRLRDAPTPRHVLVVANEFLQHLSYADRAFLPASSKPQPLDTIAELSDYAYDLKAAVAKLNGDAREATAYVASVLAEACHHLATMTSAHRPIPHLPYTEIRRASSR